MKKWRRLALLFGVLAISAAAAVPSALLTASKSSLPTRAIRTAEPDAPAIGRLPNGREGNDKRTFADSFEASMSSALKGVHMRKVMRRL